MAAAAGETRPLNGGGNGVMLHSKKRLLVASNAAAEDNVLTFTGRGSVALCKILEPLSPLLNYYEVEILASGGREHPRVGVGVGSRMYPASNQPGWKRKSIGYHADDGRLYHQRGHGRAFGPKCTTGDVMGCGIDFTTVDDSGGIQVFFTKNGQLVGEQQKMGRPQDGFYPLFGLHGKDEKVAYIGHRKCVFETLSEPMETNNSPSDFWLRANGVKFIESNSVSSTLEYAGLGDDLKDVAFAQANFPLDPINHYFELEILEGGRKCIVAIGLCSVTYPMHRYPGWNDGGIGYHGDDGKLFCGKDKSSDFGPTCTAGDRMGCGVRFKKDGDVAWNKGDESGSDLEDEDMLGDEYEMFDYDFEDSDYSDDDFDELFERRMIKIHRRAVKQESTTSCRSSRGKKQRELTVYFTKNGELVGETECRVPSGGFYPVIAMGSRGERIRVDFEPLSG